MQRYFSKQGAVVKCLKECRRILPFVSCWEILNPNGKLNPLFIFTTTHGISLLDGQTDFFNVSVYRTVLTALGKNSKFSLPLPPTVCTLGINQARRFSTPLEAGRTLTSPGTVWKSWQRKHRTSISSRRL